jgi:hypothetical protein
LRASFGWTWHIFNENEMAHSSECRDRYAQNSLDTADIVREAIFQQRRIVSESPTTYPATAACSITCDRLKL